MKEKIKSFRDLNIWKKGIDLVEEIYKSTSNFPKSEVYGLTSQMRRSAVSIVSNTAEGFARKHNKEYKHFLNIALGSCAELETQVEISLRLEYLAKSKSDTLLEDINHITRMIMNLLKCL